MKIIIFAGCLLLISCLFKNVKANSALEQSILRTKAVTAALQCIQTNPLTLKDINVFKNKMVPDGENPKCFLACAMKKMEIMDDQGMLSVAGARSKFKLFKGNEKLDNYEKLVESCLSVNDQATEDGNKGCDRAKLAFTCLLDNAPKYGFELK